MSHEVKGNFICINPENQKIHTPNDSAIDSFDEIIGYIEDLLLEDGFQSIQTNFLEKYWKVFEPVDENKLIYTDIFNEYNLSIESYIINHIQRIIPHFNMNKLLDHLEKNRSDLDGEVFEVLSTITDFLAFKEMFLDYRAVKEGRVADLSCGISVKSFNSNTNNTTR